MSFICLILCGYAGSFESGIPTIRTILLILKTQSFNDILLTIIDNVKNPNWWKSLNLVFSVVVNFKGFIASIFGIVLGWKSFIEKVSGKKRTMRKE